MRLTTFTMVLLSCLGFTMAHANEILLTSSQPISVTYKVAHKNSGGETVFDSQRTVYLNRGANISVPMNNYDLAGLVIVSADGHQLPDSANQFNQPEQCSMTTDKTKATGALEFTLTAHDASCRTYGGIFG